MTLNVTLPIERTAAWYVEHFGQAAALETEAEALYAEAARLTDLARQAGRDSVAVASITEVFNDFPLSVRPTTGKYERVEVRSPVNQYTGEAYLSQAPRHEGSWCVNIIDNTWTGPRKTGHGGTWLGDGWTREDAIAAAKSWVATGERPVKP